MSSTTELSTPLDRLGQPLYFFYSSWIIVANSLALAVVAKLIHKIRLEKKNRQLSSFTTKIIIANLATCDLATGIITLVALAFSDGDFSNFPETGCGAHTSVLGFSTYSSLVLVLLLGVVRYRTLSNNSIPEHVVKKCIVAGYISSAIYAIVPSVTGNVEVQPSHLYCFHVIGRQTVVSTFLTVTTLFTCVVPALTLLICYLRAFLQMRVVEKQFQAGSKYSPGLARLGVSIVATYFVTVLPFAAMVGFRLFADPEDQVSPMVDSVTCFMIMVNFGSNPILYFAFQPDFRRVLTRWLAPMVRGWSLARGLTTNSNDSNSGRGSISFDKSSRKSVVRMSVTATSTSLPPPAALALTPVATSHSTTAPTALTPVSVARRGIDFDDKMKNGSSSAYSPSSAAYSPSSRTKWNDSRSSMSRKSLLRLGPERVSTKDISTSHNSGEDAGRARSMSHPEIFGDEDKSKYVPSRAGARSPPSMSMSMWRDTPSRKSLLRAALTRVSTHDSSTSTLYNNGGESNAARPRSMTNPDIFNDEEKIKTKGGTSPNSPSSRRAWMGVSPSRSSLLPMSLTRISTQTSTTSTLYNNDFENPVARPRSTSHPDILDDEDKTATNGGASPQSASKKHMWMGVSSSVSRNSFLPGSIEHAPSTSHGRSTSTSTLHNSNGENDAHEALAYSLTTSQLRLPPVGEATLGEPTRIPTSLEQTLTPPQLIPSDVHPREDVAAPETTVYFASSRGVSRRRHSNHSVEPHAQV